VHLISENQEPKPINTSADNQNDNPEYYRWAENMLQWSSKNNFALFSIT